MCNNSYSLKRLHHHLHNHSTSDIGIFVLSVSIKLRNVLPSMAHSSWYKLCVYTVFIYVYRHYAAMKEGWSAAVHGSEC